MRGLYPTQNISFTAKQQSIDAVLENVRRESQRHPAGNVYETLIPTLTQRVMTNLLAFDLVRVQPGWCETEILLSSRLLYDEHNERAIQRVVEEITDEINARILQFLDNLTDDAADVVYVPYLPVCVTTACPITSETVLMFRSRAVTIVERTD